MLVRGERLAGVLLAAGGSSRLGEPKQLLGWRESTLVEYAADLCSKVCGHGVVAVTGAGAAEVIVALERVQIDIIENPVWASGLASSIRCGVRYWSGDEIGGILIMPCDQPLLTVSDLESLVAVWQTDPALPAVAAYDGVFGVPAIIPKDQLDQLTELHGDRGAQKLLAAAAKRHVVDMPNAAFDIDTREDLERLREL